MRKKKDTAMAAANDKLLDGVETAREVAGKVMDGFKKKAEKVKKLPSVVETSERRVIQDKHVFTEEEKQVVAKRLTDRLCDLTQVEEEKKSVMANYTDKVKAHKLEIGKLARQHRDGYELVDCDCVVIYDYKKREVRFKNVNTKKIVETRPFGPGDDQRRLPI